MGCIKKERRNIFSLFKVYLCDTCEYKQNDEFFVIGTNAFYIYCINGCDKTEINDDLIIISGKLKLLLRDFCLHYQNNILLWMDSLDPLEYYESSFEILSEMRMNIHIIKW